MLIILVSFAGQACSAQMAQSSTAPNAAAFQDLSKNPALVAEFGKLAGRLQHEVTMPSPREQSAVLPMLPEGTKFYVALPNYGETAHESLEIFKQELQASAELREWWQKVEPGSQGTKVEDSIEKFAQLSQYIGDEIAISGATGGHQPKVLVVAQVRKPGFKDALQQMLNELPAGSSSGLRILDPQQLAAAENVPSKHEFLVLVRPDWVVASSDLETLRSFNAHLDSGERNFVSTAFGGRVAEEYKDGATIVGGADIHTILGQLPQGTPQARSVFQNSGFADMNYLVWKQKRANGVSFGEGELGFTGPRHGIASWLDAPGPMGGLNFASPNAIMVGSMRLKNPAEMFDDVWGIVSETNPNARNGVSAFEQMLGVNLRDDLLGKLSGELTLELDGVTPKPVWRAIFGVKDPDGLQQTLTKLFTATHIVAGQAEEGGITYYTVAVPSGRTATEITYAYAPGYLILSSSHGAVRNAIDLHRSGGSLGKSAKFLAALPPGHPTRASALIYQDPVATATLQMQRLAPEMSGSLLRLLGQGKPNVAVVYAGETAIRSTSTSAGLDAAGGLIVAAVAIPNLLRSKMAANDASAVTTVRSVATAEMTYASTYPYRGFAPDLATLGRNPNGPSYTADHAALLDATIVNPTCAEDGWCTKAGFRFTIAATCSGQNCTDFTVVGTPVAASTGSRSFCASADGVIHVKASGMVTAPVSTSECRAWPPIQ
ncbi:MAG TPA: hypothetical protein VMF66_02180 [Candidatus Acidoferrum sp.]|nr:hypothetical protein [Candidatus Acidoferrum sp.]